MHQDLSETIIGFKNYKFICEKGPSLGQYFKDFIRKSNPKRQEKSNFIS